MADLSKAIAGLDAKKRELLALLAKREGVSLSRAPIVPVDRGAGPLPLSFSQERLWFLHQLEPGYSGYNLPLAFHIEGRLDPAILERAFTEISRRHEALRTTFTVVDIRPAQVIAPPAPLPLPRIDLSGIADPTRVKAEIRNHIHEEGTRPFDLERDAMLRLRLLRLAADRHVLLGTVHHIASDGWSQGLLISELVQLYDAFSAGAPSPLPELPIQYADFAAWQRQALSGPNLESQLDFWRRALGGDPPPLELPADRPRPPVPGQRGTQFGLLLPPDTASQLGPLARAEDATLFMVLLAAFEVLLHRYSGQENFAVGTPIAGRNRVETEPLIGFFVNTLALRADLTGDPTFRELLARTRQVAVGAFGHQDLPFEKLVEELQPTRDLSRTPLFQAVFSLQNTPPATTYELPGLEFVQLSGDSVSALYDLTLTGIETETELLVALNGRADLFEDATVKRMVRQLVVLLAGIAADSGRRISEIPILFPEEEKQVLLQGDGGTQAVTASGELPVHLQVMEQARRTPEALAVAGNDLALTYQELIERADGLARHLRGLGVGPESVIAVRRERSPDLVVELLGILMAGAAYLPIDPETPEDRVAFVLEDSRATDRPTGAGPLHPSNLAYVIYTSGSTGRPKGVEIPHSGLSNLIGWHREAFGVQPGDRASQLAGLGFDAAVWEIWPYLTAGASLHLVSEDVRLDPEALAGWLAEQQITHAFVPTPLVDGLEPRLVQTPGSLRFLLTGGDRLHRRPERLLPFALINNYGPTEATVVSTSGPVERGGGRPPSIGQPIPRTQAYVLDTGFRPVPVGVPGELYVGGAGLARGYRGQPGLTAERFRPNPFALEEGERLYATGDRVRWLADHSLEFLGRVDTQVKVRGFRIEPGEIEAVLAAHPAVAEAVVLPREAAPGDVRLTAYVALKDGNDGKDSKDDGLEALRGFLGDRLPTYMVPASWKTLERLPLTPNGKVDRRALSAIDPDLEAARPAGASFIAPRTPTEEAVAGLFSELLRRPLGEVGADDSFFDLGGHSLLASRLTARLRDRFDVAVPLRQVFEDPTPAGLAHYLEAARNLEVKVALPPPIRPRGAAPGEELPLSFAQQRLWFLDRMEPGGAFYNVPLAVRLSGDLKLPVLERALQEIERRHQVLRSVFPEAAGRAVQVVAPAAHRPLPLVDLSALPDGSLGTEARRLTTLEARRSFDLARGPLFRAALLRLGPADHAALLTLHHIVADGWSMGVLIRELGTLYSAFVTGKPSPLPELPIQYADFAVWQREWLEGDVLEEQLAYWRRQLAGAPAALDLPTDHPRPALQGHRGAMRPFTAGPGVAESLHELARRSEATPFMVLLAAFQTLLHRYTGQEDVVVGSPVAVLGSAEAESLIGLFTNMLVLRSDLAGDPSFRELLRRVREVALGAFFHQDLPFERLVEELRPARDLSRSPLFQVMLALQNTGGAALDLPGLTLRPLDSGGSGAARFDLTLDLSEGEAGIGGTIEYSLDLFEAATVDRLSTHFGTLLAGIAWNPDRRLSELPLLTGAEQHQAMTEWNDTSLLVEGPLAIHRQIEAQAERSPEAVALISGGVQLTYRELDQRASRVAGHLRSLGITTESRVGVSLHRSADLVTALLAVLKAGGAYVPIDPGYPAERLAFVAEDSGLAAVLVEASTAEHFAGVPVRKTLLEDAAQGAPLPTEDSIPESAAYVIYTSGSTGRPKGVVVSHANAVHFFAGMDAALLPAGWKPNGRETPPGTWLAVTSVSFDISVLELLWTLSRGFTVVVQPDATGKPVPAPRISAASRGMEFSLFYFAADESAHGADRYRLLLEGARFADAHGFTAVWTPERHFHAFGGLYPNPSITGAALAGVTRYTQIRAGSVVLPLHNPIRVAEEWSLVDNLSGGRVGISFASGWNVNDFALAPETYQGRKEVMFHSIETVRALWRGEAVRVLDGAGQSVELSILPHPLQPELPVWVTAAGNPETFRAAGQAGANLLTHLLGQSLPELADKIAAYREARRKHTDGGTGHVSLMLHAFVGEDLDEVREQVREPFKSYLRSSLGLLTEMARTLGMNANSSNLAPDEMDALLSHAFERYFEGAGLMGTVESCLEMVERLKEIGVDEVACLIDFGVETGAVLESLERLDEVRRRSQPAVIVEEVPKAAEPVAVHEEDASVAALIRHHGVTHLQCTPSMAGLLASDPESLAALASLRQVLLGGEALPETLLEKLPESLPEGLRNMYGPTETTVWSATQRVGRGESTPGGTLPLGRPIANTGIVIADPATLQPRPAGVPGELLIGGLGVTRGYLNRPDLAAERFMPDPFSGVPGSRLYRTGDLARQRPDGTLEFRGRLDHQLKIRGYRIEPGEVEAALALHPAIRENVVVARRGATADAEVRLVAYLVPNEGVEATDEALSVTALRTFLLDRLPEPLVPSAFVLLKALPLTPNGKVDRKALPAPEGAKLGVATAWVAPQNELERAIAGVWQEVLRLDRVGIHDNFFELGGTSLTIAKVHSELRRTLQRDFSMVELFRHPTIGTLARHLAGDDTAGATLAQLRERTEARAESLEKRREARRSQREIRTAG